MREITCVGPYVALGVALVLDESLDAGEQKLNHQARMDSTGSDFDSEFAAISIATSDAKADPCL